MILKPTLEVNYVREGFVFYFENSSAVNLSNSVSGLHFSLVDGAHLTVFTVCIDVLCVSDS